MSEPRRKDILGSETGREEGELEAEGQEENGVYALFIFSIK